MFGYTVSPNGAYHPELIFIFAYNQFGNSGVFRFDGTADPAVASASILGTEGSCASNIGKNCYVFSNDVIKRFDGNSSATETATIPYGNGYDNSASSLNSNIYIFGGQDGALAAGTNAKIHKWTGVAITKVGLLASPTGSHTSDTLGANIYIFGGYYYSNIHNTIQKWDGVTISTESSVMPTPNHQASIATVGSNTYIFGGSVWNGATNNIQKWDGTTISVISATLGDLSEDDFASSLSSAAYIFASGGYAGNSLYYIQKWDGVTMSSLSHKYHNNTNYCATSLTK